MVKSMAKFDRMMHAAILDCPFRGAGAAAVAPLPWSEAGRTAVTEGKGGSMTSDAVSTGFGASAGGNAEGAIMRKRSPG